MRGLPVFAEAAAAEEELLFAVFCFEATFIDNIILVYYRHFDICSANVDAAQHSGFGLAA